MTQDLLLNTTNIQNIKSAISSKFVYSSKTDFHKLFNNCNNRERLTSSMFKENLHKTDAQTQACAGSVAYDIKQLMSFLKSATDEEDSSSTNSEEQIDRIDITNLTQCENGVYINEIAEKSFHIDDNTKNEEQSEATLTLIEEFDEILTFENLDTIFDNIEITTDNTSIDTGIKTLSNKIDNESEQNIEDIINEEELKELKIESIQAESSNNSSQDDVMQNQSPQEQGIKAMLHTEVDFTEIKTEVKPEVTQATSKHVIQAEASSGKIIEQISKQMEGMYNGSRVNMVLNPESLGKVSIQLINTKEGLSAQFTVATQEARNLIMKGLDGLKDTLMSHGVSVDNVSVKINDTQETEYHPDWTEQEGSEGGYKEQGSNKNQKDKEQFEQTMSFIEDENGKV